MASKEWRLANREKHLEAQRRANAKNGEYRRNWHLKRRYGITSEEYDVLLDQQDGACAICYEPEGARRLHVDHNHETGAVRGLLCFACNTSLAHLERVEWRRSADKYLHR